MYVSEERMILIYVKSILFLHYGECVLNPGKGYPLQEIISSLGLTFKQDARGHVLTVMLHCEFRVWVWELCLPSL